MIVRRAAPADGSALVRVINRAYRVEEFFVVGDRTTDDDVARRLALPGAAFLVVDDEEPGRLAGAVFVEVRKDRGYFGLLSVDPDRQRRGLGRLLVRAAEAHCRAAGCRFMDLDVVNLRRELPGFYRSLGYEDTGSAPFPAGERLRREAHLVVMSKALA
ncbi:MAG TPA: GNAT family N-acetyltransferase [Gemmatimonadaceae bacterium]|nr:GNAT family N-acetyltransferase [Gemmatimonadaceae bacterium]